MKAWVSTISVINIPKEHAQITKMISAVLMSSVNRTRDHPYVCEEILGYVL